MGEMREVRESSLVKVDEDVSAKGGRRFKSKK